MKSIILALAVAVAIDAQSVKSCGSATDILKNATFTVNPDPINPSAPLTITATGTLSAAVTDQVLFADLAIKALGIINEPVKGSVPLSFLPGLPAGDIKLDIGPFTLPHIPGGLDVSGTVTSKSGTAQIFCVALDTKLLADPNEPPPMPEMSLAILTKVGDPITDCGTDKGHLHNRTLSFSGGVLDATGDLDESVSAGEADVDLTVKVSFIHLPVKMTIPFSISPPIPKGPVTVKAGPPSNAGAMIASQGVKVEVTGTVKLNDANKEEISCLSIDV